MVRYPIATGALRQLHLAGGQAERGDRDIARRSDLTEQDLFDRVQKKDRLAFEELYRRYYRRLHGYLLRMTSRPELVEETINEVMFVVWKDAKRFRGQSRLSTWIFGIAHRQALKILDRRARHEREVPEEAVALAGPRSPEEHARLGELRRDLQQAVAGLSPDHRAVVELTYFHDCTYEEIASIVGCPVNTVKTRMFYARRNLREILQRLSFCPP